MADSTWAVGSVSTGRHRASPRHPAFVRITHWLTALCFFALLVSGVEVLISHPRFYWGETGNVNTKPLFSLPIPASRASVPTGYNFVLPDQNGWSRALHFQAAWLLVFAGLYYTLAGLARGHFRRELLPGLSGNAGYNPLQRLTYLAVVFLLFPLVYWTGLAMSPAFESAIPAAVTAFGGRQSARTIHFFLAVFLVLFLTVHVAKVYQAGFRQRVRAMVTGGIPDKENQA